MTAAVATALQGFAIGFAIAAPVGPMGMLCIRRTLAFGPVVGLASGLGTACADGLYGLVVAFGLGAVAAVLMAHTSALRMAGAVVLIWLGVAALRQALRRHNAMVALPQRPVRVFGSFASALLLTLANPTTIIAFAGLLAALATPAAGGGTMQRGLALVGGIFAGSVAWWLLLVSGVSLARASLPGGVLRWIEAASALLFLGFGLRAAWLVLG